MENIYFCSSLQFIAAQAMCCVSIAIRHVWFEVLGRIFTARKR